MNDKMTFHRIASSIATSTGCTDEEAAMFLRALLDKASEALVNGEKVTINGIGTFAPFPLSPEAVVWAPDASLAEAVNEPFAAFEPVRLAPGVTEEALAETSAVPGKTEEIVAVIAGEKAVEEVGVEAMPDADDTAAREITPSDASRENTDTVVEADTHVEPAAPVETTDNVADESVPTDGEVMDESAAVVDTTPEVMSGADQQPAEEPAEEAAAPAQPKSVRAWAEEGNDSVPEQEPVVIYRERSGLNPWLMLLIGVLVGLAMGYFVGMSFGYLGGGDTESEMLDAEEEELIDSVADDGFITEIGETATAAPVAAEPEAQPAAPAAETTVAEPAPKPAAAPQTPKVVTDTVTGRRYLTTMARKYYGNNCFWVYIYEENADKISNPDLIRPGTVVVIPPASKYGIDASDPASVRRATAKIGEIESRTKRRR